MFVVTLRSVSGLKRLTLKKASLSNAVVAAATFQLKYSRTSCFAWKHNTVKFFLTMSAMGMEKRVK